MPKNQNAPFKVATKKLHQNKIKNQKSNEFQMETEWRHKIELNFKVATQKLCLMKCAMTNTTGLQIQLQIIFIQMKIIMILICYYSNCLNYHKIRFA